MGIKISGFAIFLSALIFIPSVQLTSSRSLVCCVALVGNTFSRSLPGFQGTGQLYIKTPIGYKRLFLSLPQFDIIDAAEYLSRFCPLYLQNNRTRNLD